MVSIKVKSLVDLYSPKGNDFPLLPTSVGALTRCQTVHDDFDARKFCMKIHGKIDNASKCPAIHQDWECPDFDLVVHLL